MEVRRLIRVEFEHKKTKSKSFLMGVILVAF